ncbi:MAG: UDP-N-acetylmuramoyl-L-alanyl-D-glutamate--2,6-diaminopimelate ligase [Actinobacteria bacterium]|nr:UDP-N-acetylmuramoyl-L-alanyl-D-glutamate--2,6-diaminopimelate ligase [Actinomycetota bacterium]
MVESRAVRLADLLREVGGFHVEGDPSTDISHLSYRSSQAGPGHLFFCVPGFVRDGHDFALEALERGASALCVERTLDLPVTQVVVPSVRRAMGPVASALYEHPSARLATVGITGTNGKTTTSFLLAYLLGEAGRRAGLLGTIERRIGGETFPTERTTPEAVDVQQDLALMVDAGDQAAVMEVSSHAIDLDRVLGTTYAAVAFTNLTQDHLDYHGTLDAYFACKSRLFLDPAYARNRPSAVINVGDAFGALLAERLTPDRVIGVSASDGGADEAGVGADLGVADLVIDGRGVTGSLIVSGRALGAVRRGRGEPVVKGDLLTLDLSMKLLGRHNVENVLVALGLGVSLGLDLEGMVDALPMFPGVPGRLERVDEGGPFTVAVDYAHTPDSVERILAMGRVIAEGRVIAVLGCGGDRDRTKRPLMGLAMEKGAHVAILTSDNPRSEDPAAIIEEMTAALEHPETVRIEVDRRKAIEAAIAMAEPGDLVLILGKGHESGQESLGVVTPFDDRVVAREALWESGSLRS